MESAVLGWVSQGLQHEVIAMASCCKKGGGQKGNNCHRQTCTGTTGVTVLRRDSGVVAGADLRLSLALHIPATRWAMYQGAPGPLSTHVPYAGCFHTWKRTPPSE